MSPSRSTQTGSPSWLDRAGAVGLLCALHCMALPVLVGLLPLLGRLPDEPVEWVEHALVATALLVGASAALLGWRQHREPRLLMLFVVGLGLLALSMTLEGDDAWLLVPATAIVTGAHLWSYRLGRRSRPPSNL